MCFNRETDIKVFHWCQFYSSFFSFFIEFFVYIITLILWNFTSYINTLNDIHSFFTDHWQSKQRKRTYIIFLEIVNKFKNLYTDKILISNFSIFVIWQNKSADSLKKNIDEDEKDKKQREFNSDTMSCICNSKH